MGNNLTLHAEGTPVCSFENSAKTPIESLKAYFAPTQSGSGDPSPSNVREIQGWTGLKISKCGKNLFDGTIINRRIVDGEWSSTSTWQSTDLIPVKSNTKYTMTLNGTAYIPYIYEFGVDKKYNGYYYTASSTITTYSTTCYIALVGLKSVDWEYLCIEETDQTLPYSFSGETIPITFPVLGKNKFSDSINDYTYFNASHSTYSHTFENGEFSATVPSGVRDYIVLIGKITYPAGTYTLSYDYLNGAENIKWQPIVVQYTSNWYTSKCGNAANSSSGHFEGTFTCDAPFTINLCLNSFDTTTQSGFNKIYNFQLELGDTATTYEPYNPNNTVYGGYVDLVKGEVVAEDIIFAINEETTLDSCVVAHNVLRPCYNLPIIGSNKNVIMSNIFGLRARNTASWNYPSKGLCSLEPYSTETEQVIFGAPENITTQQEWLDWVEANGPIEVCYELNTPIHYPLTPIQLSALRSQNYIWSNASNKISVDYELHETRAISDAKKRIAANEPHIETISSSIATFNTDMRAPIKSCKVYFTPVQAGSGDPSTTNIRNISGWTGLNAKFNGKNWIDLAYVSNANSYSNVGSYGYVYTDDIQLIPNTKYRFVWSNYDSSKLSDVYLYVSGASQYIVDSSASVHGYRQYPSGFTTSNTGIIRFGINKYNYATIEDALNAIFTNGDLLLQLGTSDESYESYNGTTIPLDWTSTAGTAYGGYVDLITGELVLDRYLYTFDGTEDWTYQWGTSSANGVIRLNHLADYGIPINHAISSAYTTLSFGQIQSVISSNTTYGCYLNNSDYFNYRDADYALLGERTSNEVKAAWKQQVADAYANGTPYQICFTLLGDSIIHYQLTPTQLKTLVGTNNIWANTGSVEVSYWKH